MQIPICIRQSSLDTASRLQLGFGPVPGPGLSLGFSLGFQHNVGKPQQHSYAMPPSAALRLSLSPSPVSLSLVLWSVATLRFLRVSFESGVSRTKENNKKKDTTTSILMYFLVSFSPFLCFNLRLLLFASQLKVKREALHQ